MTQFVGFLKQVNRFVSLISQGCIFFSSIALVVLLTIFGWLVFGRYVLNDTPTWVEQLALLLVVYITFIGSAAGVHEDTHLGVSFIREAMPDYIRRPLRIIVDIIMCCFGLVMFLASSKLVAFGWDSKLAMLGLPEGVRTLAAAICGGFIFIFAGVHAITKIYNYYFAPVAAQESN